MNKGMSLLEVTIGMTLFSVLMVLVIETTLSIRDFSANHEESIDLEEEGRRIIKQFTADFSNSAWYSDGSDVFPIVPPVGTPDGISATNYGNSVKFLRLRSNGSDKSQVGIALFDFNTPSSRMSEWKTPSSTVPGLIVDDTYTLSSGKPLVSQVWEPKGGNRDVPLDFEGNGTLSNLRVYQYKVYAPDNTIGRGVLWREFSDSSGAAGSFQKDHSIGELGRHIHWFIVKVDPGTQRVRLFLELRGPEQESGKEAAVRRFSAVIAMRSMN